MDRMVTIAIALLFVLPDAGYAQFRGGRALPPVHAPEGGRPIRTDLGPANPKATPIITSPDLGPSQQQAAQANLAATPPQTGTTQVEPPPAPAPEPTPSDWGCNDGNIAGSPDACGDGNNVLAAASGPGREDGMMFWLVVIVLGALAVVLGWKVAGIRRR
ncbi:MAG TPA: hypothetical protein VLK25_00225 [Allosphingosinicella sp.]|nr:hypothetical protein [Allosphingosinicella sp.]